MTRTATGTSASTAGRLAPPPAAPEPTETAALAAVTMPACWPSPASGAEEDPGRARSDGTGPFNRVPPILPSTPPPSGPAGIPGVVWPVGPRGTPGPARSSPGRGTVPAVTAGRNHHGTARSALRSSPAPGAAVRPPAVRAAVLPATLGTARAAAGRSGDRPLPLPAPHRTARADRAGPHGGLLPAHGRPAAAGARPARGRRPGR